MLFRRKKKPEFIDGMIEELEHFDGWFDEPEIRALQERNVKANIRWFKRKLRYYEKKLKGMKE